MKFQYKENWRSTNSSVKDFSGDEEQLKTIIKHRPESLEFLGAYAIHYGYFDADVVCPIYETSESFGEADAKYMTKIKLAIESYLNCRVKSICTSSVMGYKGLSKHSFHFVVDRLVSRLVLRRVVPEINKILGSNYLDSKVYGNTQCFRLIGCSKPSENRPKELIFGSIADTLLGNVKDEDITHPESFSLFFTDKNFLWFNDAMENEKLMQLFKKKSDDYDSWLEVSMALAYECDRDKSLLMQARYLFHKFSKFSSKFLKESCDEKLTSLLGVVFQDHFKVIRNWVCYATSKTVERIKKNNKDKETTEDSGVDAPEIGQSILPSECSPLLSLPHLDFKPYSAMQYLLWQTTIHQQYWQNEITSPETLARIVALLKYLPPEEEQFWSTFGTSLFKANEDYGLKLLPFPEDDNYDIKFLLEFSRICGHEISNEQCRELLSIVYSKSSMEKAYNTFLTVFPLLPHISLLLGESIRSVKKQQDVDPFARILTVATKETVYQCQFPFQESIRKLWMYAEDEKHFRFLIMRSTDKVFRGEQYFHFFSNACDSLKASKIVLSIYPYWTFSGSTYYVYNYFDGLWSENIEVMGNVVSELSIFLGSDESNFGTSYTSVQNVIKFIKQDERSRDLSVFVQLKHSSLRCLLYQNGVYFGETCSFRAASSISENEHLMYTKRLFYFPEVMFFAKISDPYLTEPLPEDIEEIVRMKKQLFYDMHGEDVGNYHMECIATAILGERFKGFFIHIGDTNSGKSTEKALIEATFGDFVGTASTDEFASIKDDKRESSLSNSMAYDNWYKRFVGFSENTERILDTEKLKAQSSGGEDKIRARSQYARAGTFDIHYMMFFYLNSSIKVTNPDDSAFKERANYFYWNKVFVDEIQDDSYQLLKNPEVCRWKDSMKRRQLYNLLILSSYEDFRRRGTRLEVPDSVKQFTRSEVGQVETHDDLACKLLYLFVMDGNEEHYCTRADFLKQCTDAGLQGEKVALKLPHIIKKLCLPERTILNKQMSIHGRRQQVWVGMHPRGSIIVPEGEYLTDYGQWFSLMKQYNGKIPVILMNQLKKVARLLLEQHSLLSAEDKQLVEELGTDYQKSLVSNKRARVV